MDRKAHCKHNKDIFGTDYNHVHLWLDELASVGKLFDMNHRIHRHNLEGIAEIRRWWGDGAALAAEQHIMDDFGFIVSRAELIRCYGSKQDLVWWSSIRGGD
jgi:hypothetical protein